MSRHVLEVLSVARNHPRGRTFLVREDAATMVEYAFMVAMIALVCFTAVTLFGSGTSSLFSNPTLLGVH